ncbi:hypothetical protein GGR55DRAFT_292507 [Xylaria sp. FL0064]|nr:hypothetical protein GGR55DRAFT_292507 [Xylaria sp. FL0064]
MLFSDFPGQVAFPGDATYNVSLSSHAYAQEQKQTPSCVLRPSSTSEVSLAIQILRKSSSRFASRSGGHATNKGFSNIDSAVTLDLALLNRVQVLRDNSTVSVGTGASWGDVYSVLDARNLSLHGGRASGVGAGGFLFFECMAVESTWVLHYNGHYEDEAEIANDVGTIEVPFGVQFGAVPRPS